MAMAESKGKGLLLGLGMPVGRGEDMGDMSSPDPLAEESEGDAEMAAAQDLIDAVGSGSASAVKAALRASYDACAAPKDMSDDDEY